MLLTLMRFCGLFAAWTACTAWADERETSLGGGGVVSSSLTTTARGCLLAFLHLWHWWFL